YQKRFWLFGRVMHKSFQTHFAITTYSRDQTPSSVFVSQHAKVHQLISLHVPKKIWAVWASYAQILSNSFCDHNLFPRPNAKLRFRFSTCKSASANKPPCTKKDLGCLGELCTNPFKLILR